jgi:hypothetical protein
MTYLLAYAPGFAAAVGWNPPAGWVHRPLPLPGDRLDVQVEALRAAIGAMLALRGPASTTPSGAVSAVTAGASSRPDGSDEVLAGFPFAGGAAAPVTGKKPTGTGFSGRTAG